MKNENMIISPCVYIYKKTENNLRIEKLFFFFFNFKLIAVTLSIDFNQDQK